MNGGSDLGIGNQFEAFKGVPLSGFEVGVGRVASLIDRCHRFSPAPGAKIYTDTGGRRN